MTEMQNMMLSVCFGTVVGMMIGNITFLISCAVDHFKEKCRKRKEAKENANKAE